MNGDERTRAHQGRYKTAQAVVVALLVVGLLTAIFIFQNTDRAKVHFLFWSGSIPLAGALILAAALGGIFSFLVVFVRRAGLLEISGIRPVRLDPPLVNRTRVE